MAVDFLGSGPAWWGGLVLVAGSASALVGVLYALAENDLKRLLAYSSVENIGVIFLGIGAGLVLQSYGLHALALVGFGAALLHSVNHACFKALLFLATGNVDHQAHTRNMEQMGGLIKGMPQTATLFLIGSAAAAALPPLNGFASEWMVFQALLSGAQIPRPEVAIGAPLAVGVLAAHQRPRGRVLRQGLRHQLSGDAALGGRRSCDGVPLVHARGDGCAGGGMRAAGPGRAACRSAACTGFSSACLRACRSRRRRRRPACGCCRRTASRKYRRCSSAALLTSVIVVVAAVIRVRGLVVRSADTWGCGRIRQTPRMEYTSSAFAEPLRRIFSELYRPTEDLSISVHPESPYFVRSITYTSQVVPWLEKAFYDPVIRGTRALATHVRRLQAGSVHVYLLYITGALLVALASAWWFG